MSSYPLTEGPKRPAKRKVTFYIDPDLYVKFGSKVVEEKRRMDAISEKISELIEAYVGQPTS